MYLLFLDPSLNNKVHYIAPPRGKRKQGKEVENMLASILRRQSQNLEKTSQSYRSIPYSLVGKERNARSSHITI